jgi:bifunctional UDP-N-acetylglucosamine pyrophosphorylase/glucosamine-1-phosphate N-acetyltransferase
MFTNLQAIVLAGGNSNQTIRKTMLVEKICGKEIILYPTTLLAQLQIPTTVVVGYQKELVMETIIKHHASTVDFAIQQEQHGTGHAIACTQDIWKHDYILIMNGNVPLVTPETIETLYKQHIQTEAHLSFIMAHNSDPISLSYGRVIKDNEYVQIIEAHKFNGDLHEHCCINAGIYLVNRTFLQNHVHEIKKCEEKHAFYITDLVRIASEKKYPITTISVPFDIIRGINTYQELWAVEQIKRAELIRYWMDRGVRFSTAQTVHLDSDIIIGQGSFIGSGVHLLQGTIIGNNCTIEPFCIITQAVIEDNTVIRAHSVISHSQIHTQAQIGPFAHIRNSSVIGPECIIGNFVEVKQSIIGQQTRAKHLTYLGDAEIGSHVNIGAGTITCNHNGVIKQKTVIQDNAYIGSNNSLVAPVTIENNAYTAAGSVITQTVPANALGIARSRQINKLDYVKKMKENNQEKKENNEQTQVSFIGAVKVDNDNESPMK